MCVLFCLADFNLLHSRICYLAELNFNYHRHCVVVVVVLYLFFFYKKKRSSRIYRSLFFSRLPQKWGKHLWQREACIPRTVRTSTHHEHAWRMAAVLCCTIFESRWKSDSCIRTKASTIGHAASRNANQLNQTLLIKDDAHVFRRGRSVKIPSRG